MAGRHSSTLIWSGSSSQYGRVAKPDYRQPTSQAGWFHFPHFAALSSQRLRCDVLHRYTALPWLNLNYFPLDANLWHISICIYKNSRSFPFYSVIYYFLIPTMELLCWDSWWILRVRSLFTWTDPNVHLKAAQGRSAWKAVVHQAAWWGLN